MSYPFPYRPLSSTPPQGQSPLRDRAEARRDARQAVSRTAEVVRLEGHIGDALADLIVLGVDVSRLDMAALAEAGQQRRRARGL